MCAIGNALMFSPSSLYINQWFIHKKGLALGIMWAAKSVTGVVLPFAANFCLHHFGSSTTFRVWTVTTVWSPGSLLRFVANLWRGTNLGGVCRCPNASSTNTESQLLTTLGSLPFMKPRIPVSPSASARRLDLGFLRLAAFWTLQAGNIIQSFGYFLPSTYLPSYSTATVGLSRTMGTMLVSLFNATSIVGGICMGMLCDRFAVSNILLLSSMGSALSVFLLWGMASSPGSDSPRTGIALLTLFSIFYGFFAGGFSSTWSGVIKQIKRDSSTSLETGLVFGLLAGGRGIGNVISGPLSTALIKQGSLGGSQTSNAGTGFSTQYGTLILFTGITAALGAWSSMWGYISSSVRCVSR